MTPVLTIHFWNQMLKTQNEPNVKSKAKKERKKLLLPTVWKGGLSKNTPIPESLWAYMQMFTPSLSSP